MAPTRSGIDFAPLAVIEAGTLSRRTETMTCRHHYYKYILLHRWVILILFLDWLLHLQVCRLRSSCTIDDTLPELFQRRYRLPWPWRDRRRFRTLYSPVVTSKLCLPPRDKDVTSRPIATSWGFETSGLNAIGGFGAREKPTGDLKFCL